MDDGAAWFPSACVASPHHLASATGLRVLASGGNALDAAIATNLTLAVVTPYLCGFGGDLFAIVWQDGAHGYNGSGRAPARASIDFITGHTGSHSMPLFGPHSVTVPGAVAAWFELLDRFGTRTFADLAADARRYAEEGFELSAAAADVIRRSRARYEGEKDWLSVYGEARPGLMFRQQALARTIDRLSTEGPSAFYRGDIGAAIVATLQARGASMTIRDLAEHSGDWVQPLSCSYHGFDILEMPPNTQGVAVLEALRISDALRATQHHGGARHHLLIEAIKLALSDRDRFVGDPAAMSIDAERLFSEDWVRERAASVDPERAGSPPIGRPARAGTAYVCAADASGMCVSLIQSNYVGFGSGVHVADWGINLQNRGGYFSLDPDHVNAIGPRKRTLHTLIPALVLRDGRPWLVFGTMGGDGQAQTHLQVLTRILDDGADPQSAINEPRWVVSPSDWGVIAESDLGEETIGMLTEKGHAVEVTQPLNPTMGHAHAVLVGERGYTGASDPRSEGAAVGF
jgi:gamma-glutamyltranspeptidase/glutathione hydrolase